MGTFKICKKCGVQKQLNTDNFNLLSSGYWRGTCKTCMAENTMLHYQRDPKKVVARVDKYKKALAEAGGSFNEKDVEIIRRRLKDCCAYCGLALNGFGEVDHVIPVSRGGNSFPSNLTLACRTCNRDKSNKTVEEFIQWRISLNLPIRKKRTKR